MAEDDKDKNETPNDDTSSEKSSGVNAPIKKKTARLENPSLPKDRNARVREQAARKMQEARTKRPGASGALSTEELVDDALARGFARVTKWAKANVRYIEIGVVALLLVGIGYAVYDWQFNKKLENASDALNRAVQDEMGRVVKDDQSKPDDPEQMSDPRPKFPTAEARDEAALSGYRQAAVQYAGTGAAILARLGEAGVLLDRKDYDGAITAFRAVLDTPLAKADLDVQLNATEGLGMALEGKGDIDGAMDAYKKLEGSKERGYQELGMYDQARILLYKKNERELAKALLLKAKEVISQAPSDAPAARDFLSEQINALLREIDPSLAPTQSTGGSLDQMSIEQLMEQKRLLDRLRAQHGAPPLTGSPAPLPAPSGAP